METSQWKVQDIEVRCLSSPIRITRVYARILCRNEKKLDLCAMVITDQKTWQKNWTANYRSAVQNSLTKQLPLQ